MKPFKRFIYYVFRRKVKLNKKNIFLMNAIILLQGLVFYGPIATVYRLNKGINIKEIFLIESIFIIFSLLFEVPWGIFADKFGYKRTIVISNLIFFISKIIFFKANSFALFIVERIFLAIAISGLSGVDSAIIYESLDNKEDSEKVFSRYIGCSNIGYLLGSLLSIFIVSKSMDLAAFYTIIPYGLAFLMSLFIKDIKYENREKVSLISNFKSIINNKKIIIFIFGTAILSEVAHGITAFLNQNQYLKSGINIKYFGLIVVFDQLLKILGIKTYKITSKIVNVNLIIIMAIIIGLNSFGLVFTSNKIVSIVLISVISLAITLIEPLIVDIENKSVTTQDRATVLSIYSIIGSIVSLTVNPYIGKFAEVSIERGFIFCSIVSLVSVSLIIFYKKLNNKNNIG